MTAAAFIAERRAPVSAAARFRRRSFFVTEILLHRVAAGDQGAMQALIDRFGGLVWSLARRFCSTEAEAEEAVQEIFVDVWQSASRYDAASGAEATFIATIARRRLIDRRRRSDRQKRLVESVGRERPDAAPDRTDEVALGDEAARAAAFLASVSPEQQRVLRLSIYQGLSHEEIAQSTGLPLGTVKTHIRRGLIKLRDLLASARPAEAIG